GIQWLRQHELPHLVIAAITSIIHPRFFTAGMATHATMLCYHESAPYITSWGNPYSAVAIVANRRSIPHYDKHSVATIPDLLITLGGDPSTTLTLHELGARLAYTGGTFCAFSGRRIMHEVSESKTDHMCYAYYPRGPNYILHGVPVPGEELYCNVVSAVGFNM
ncbi:hypothetical protein FOMPIDRAFT_1135370, partial [Fomitopsis schrenkii]